MRATTFAPRRQHPFVLLPFLAKLGIALTILGMSATHGFGQSYKILHTFPGAAPPNSSVIQGLDGNLYGTTANGGMHGKGTVYRLTPSGTLTTVYSFCAVANCADGEGPWSLTVGSDGNFYGTTVGGGTGNVHCGSGCGTIFKLTPGGTLTTLHNFCVQAPCEDGSGSYALVQGTDGNFYGVTSTTPENGGNDHDVAFFKITPTGEFTTLYAFCSGNNCASGGGPTASIIQGTDGQFYGVTSQGAANDLGGIFEATSAGVLTLLYSFEGPQNPGFHSQLLQANNGNFYGMIEIGGPNECANALLCGSLYEMTPSGDVTTLLNFDGSDGASPVGGFVQAADGNLYGATMLGGSNGGGTIFKMTPAGTLTTLYDFCAINCTTGFEPFVGLYQATNGLFYGAAYSGEEGAAVLFSLSAGLKPFVDTVPASGRVGTKVIILGNNLTGSTAVSFNGTAATFTVVSPTEITTTVPTGAISGKVKVTTPSGVLSTTVKFRVP